MYKDEFIKNSKKNFFYLNEGVGKLWAGQIRVTEFFTSLVMLLELTSSENFGFWPPTGSMQQFLKIIQNIDTFETNSLNPWTEMSNPSPPQVTASPVQPESPRSQA